MVCPNCHSDKVIQVQDQFFCINCGQAVPDSAVKTSAKVEAKLAVQDNGLPEGVKVIPVAGKGPDLAKPHAPSNTADAKQPAVKVDAGAHKAEPPPADDSGDLVKQRKRMAAGDTPPPAATAKRKPGRPKAGRLDVPVSAAATTAAPAAKPPEPKPVPAQPPAVLPEAPKIHSHAAKQPRRLSDIAPRRKPDQPPETKEVDEHPAEKSQPEPPKDHAQQTPPPKSRHHVSRVDVAPLHFGAITKASLRARVHPGYFGLSALAAAALAAAAAYGAWLYLSGGLPHVADCVLHAGALSIAEAVVLALLYYIGRSVSQAAIIYGTMRDHDGRTVSLAKQIAVGVNTFPRRLGLDVASATLALGLLAGAATLIVIGGSSWPVSQEIQVAALFGAFLVILYLLTALAISRGLAGVAVTVTPEEPMEAAKLGWHLFSHRFELLGFRFLAMAVEVVLAVPLIAAAVALLAAAPAGLHALAAVGVGLLAWLAGALLGAGTAGWWSSLYRQLVLADQPERATALLSGHQPASARPADLTLVVALTSFLIAAALALPWLKLG
jgi:hypothetical protein